MKIFLVLLACLPALAYAKLGDTESQCLDQYGASVNQTTGSGVGEKLVFYEKGGMGIGVEYWNGKAACLFFKKTLRTEILSETEIEAFLKENSDGSYWENANIIGEGRRWARKDGKALANYVPKQGLLIVMTDAFALQRMKNKQAAGQ